MKILALEFSSDQRSVALGENASGVAIILGSASEKGGRSTRAIALIENVLSQAGCQRHEIDCIAIGIGPGSYTGIRAAIALTQGWQLATSVKTLGVSSVECLAAQAQALKLWGSVNIVVDAQRGEFYLGDYRISETERSELEPLRLVPSDEIKRRLAAGQIVTGPDANIFGGREMFPEASTLAALAATRANFLPAEKLEPIYLREVNFVKAPPPRIV